MSAPNATKQTSLKELTLRGIILGGIITLLFTAANVYLGLKVGLTFATSIPAAVISMAVLRFWGDHTVQETTLSRPSPRRPVPCRRSSSSSPAS